MCARYVFGERGSHNMIKLAFCDDEISALNELRILFDQYRVDRNEDIEYTAFHSPLDLLAEIERGVRYDIFFWTC